MENYRTPHVLVGQPLVSSDLLSRVRADYERLAVEGLPNCLEEYLAEHYQLDVAADYAGFALKNPWGKASGQLSMTSRQVADDVAAGLSFVVLKTVIAEDASGEQTMKAWAIPESRMLAEPIVGQSGESGWTISWKGRGWWHSFEDYLQLIRDAQHVAAGSGTLIVPSCKYHLPMPGESEWRVAEYSHTTPRILQAWLEGADSATAVMPLEKDFSPTLAGSDRAAAQARILEWLREVPTLIRQSVSEPLIGDDRASGRGEVPDIDDSRGAKVRVGLKLFNALFDDDFQLAMLRSIQTPGAGRPDFYVYGNRLFDPQCEFDGKRGIAYGGPDLSDRNLRVMTRFQQEQSSTEPFPGSPLRPDAADHISPADLPLRDLPWSELPWSATGNITTGRMALEYALRGASSFQLHTFFQLPARVYRMQAGSKTQKGLHELYFHPETGFIVWMHDIASRLGLPNRPIRFADIVGQGPRYPDAE